MKKYKIDKESENKVLAESVVAREIVQEILKYGVSQLQIQKIIKMLALELEDNKKLKGVCDAIEGVEIEKKTELIIQE